MDIVIDFDGTCVTHSFPEIGKEIGAAPVLNKLVTAGHRLILSTMRSDGQREQVLSNGYKMHEGDFLTQAVGWFKENDIPLFGIQRNPEQDAWTDSPKAYGHLLIDDTALGCPLRIDLSLSNRPFVDWGKVEDFLIKKGLI